MAPQRKSLSARFVSESAQGPDSYVLFKKYYWEERKKLQEDFYKLASAKPSSEGGESGATRLLTDRLEQEILSRLTGWNWVDENNAPLPLPKTSEDLGKLPDEEIQYLFDTIQELIRGAVGVSDELKN